MPLAADHHVIESRFSPRRWRRPLYPWLPRIDRVVSIDGLNHGLVPPYLIPLDDEIPRDWVSFDANFDYVYATDDYVTGPLVRPGSHARYVRAYVNSDPSALNLTGWRLYFTPTAPASIADLLDVYEVFPIIRRSDGTPVPSQRWGAGYWSRVSPADRRRNYYGYYSLRWTDPLPYIAKAYFRVIIEQPPEPF